MVSFLVFDSILDWNDDLIQRMFGMRTLPTSKCSRTRYAIYIFNTFCGLLTYVITGCAST
jgi:hypothetical protein